MESSENTFLGPFYQALEKISENPISLSLYVFGMMQTIARYVSDDVDPVNIISEILASIYKDPTTSKLVKSFIKFLMKILTFEYQHVKGCILAIMFTIPSVVSFNISYFLTECVIVLLFIHSTIIPLWYSVILAHFWYVYRLNDKIPKIYLVIFIAFFVYLGVQIDSKESLRIPHKDNVTSILKTFEIL